MINSFLDECLYNIFKGYIYDTENDSVGAKIYVEVFDFVYLAITLSFDMVSDEQTIIIEDF